MRAIGPATRSLEQAFGMGPALLARAAAERAPWIAASLIEGPAIALGALQRAGRVVDLDVAMALGVRVIRRATSGTAAYIGRRAVLFSLALPHVAALVPDASPRTLLNRNVRGFLKGLGRAGVSAHYFGREWISVKHRPVALLGFEASRGGAVLIEVVAGIDAPIGLPAEIATEGERAVDRWLGKEPASLEEVIGAAIAPEVLAEQVVQGVAKHAAATLEHIAAPSGAGAAREVTNAGDPVPAGFTLGPMVKVPIGWVETAFEPVSGRVWLGGDVLSPAFAVQAIAAAAAGKAAEAVDESAVPVAGALVSDLAAAAQAAACAARRASRDSQ
jgi:hypothetical protein